MSYYIFKIKCRGKMSSILIHQLHSYFRAINIPSVKNKKKFLLNFQKLMTVYVFIYLGFTVQYNSLIVIINRVHNTQKANRRLLSRRIWCKILKLAFMPWKVAPRFSCHISIKQFVKYGFVLVNVCFDAHCI